MRIFMNIPNLLSNKKAFITGAGQGNGRAIAIGMAEAGALVIVTDMNSDNARQTAELIREKGGQARHYQLDVTDLEQCHATAAKVDAEVGSIDILVNNAGIIIRDGIDSPNAAH